MELPQQILWGTAVLAFCAFIHVAVIAVSVPFLKFAADQIELRILAVKIAVLIGFASVLTVLAHTIQVWLWAIILLWFGAQADLSTAIYFSLVTYTTLGYGDLTLGENLRVFGAFAAVTGLLTFGVSAAFLVALIGEMIPRGLGGDHRQR